ncbi:MAG TPA: bifunctional phosphoribosylaminoimidazolecarboxamide formyltransferase/inosine monophosphate cyclohydrolase, partial [Thermoanaerobaculia bacterium]|nr:bifunctional phosphoribosylaminoimidazolecarboxamide formyltransferase/inosine monophosphate cyclohydrolase [Thermoanaerobaculia bacterium]
MLPAHRALVSVSDKSGLAELAQGLRSLGIEIVSTGGTLAYLRQLGVPAVAVADVTGFPEILDGRVKTLHPRIHAGILASRSQPSHTEQLASHQIDRIDLVVVNLYPFRETAADPNASFEEVIEKIDIGGPAMVRAAAKNFGGVAVVVDPTDYSRVLAALSASDGVVPEALRRELAVKAFRHTHAYDGTVADWLARQAASGTAPGVGAAGAPGEAAAGAPGAAAAAATSADAFPARLALELARTDALRYGENPHQGGAVYAVTHAAAPPASTSSPASTATQASPASPASPALAAFTAAGGALGGYRQLAGKELSWNNLLDADAARKMASLWTEPVVVIVKHNNPCGIGRGADLTAAYQRALATDPVSAFGSVIAVNGTVDGRLAAAMADLFVEVLLAPGFDEDARRHFAQKKNLRLVECPAYRPAAGEIELRAISGGFLAQQPDAFPDDPAAWTSPTRRGPTGEERRALDFAWRVSRYVKSNAIVLANADQTVGVGAGQMSRVDSCRIAIQKAQLPVAGTVAASDAFFPFRDGLDVLAGAGVTAVAQPGGSKR